METSTEQAKIARNAKPFPQVLPPDNPSSVLVMDEDPLALGEALQAATEWLAVREDVLQIGTPIRGKACNPWRVWTDIHFIGGYGVTGQGPTLTTALRDFAQNMPGGD